MDLTYRRVLQTLLVLFLVYQVMRLLFGSSEEDEQTRDHRHGSFRLALFLMKKALGS